MNETPEFLNVEQIAALFGFSVEHTRDRLVKLPGFPTPCKLGGSRRWVKPEVLAYALSHREPERKRRGR